MRNARHPGGYMNELVARDRPLRIPGTGTYKRQHHGLKVGVYYECLILRCLYTMPIAVPLH